MKTKIVRRILAAIVAAATLTSISGVASAGKKNKGKIEPSAQPAGQKIETVRKVRKFKTIKQSGLGEFVENFFEKYQGDNIEKNVKKLRSCLHQKNLSKKAAEILSQLFRDNLLKGLKTSSLIAMIESLHTGASEGDGETKSVIAELVSQITSADITIENGFDIETYVEYISKTLDECLNKTNMTTIKRSVARAIRDLSKKPAYRAKLNISSVMRMLERCDGLLTKPLIAQAIRALTDGDEIDNAFRAHTPAILKIFEECSKDSRARADIAFVVMRMREANFFDANAVNAANNVENAIKILSTCWNMGVENARVWWHGKSSNVELEKFEK